MPTTEQLKKTYDNQEEREYFNQVDTLPTSLLTKGLLATGALVTGYWYNTGLSAYVNINSRDWAFATKTSISGAVKFKAYLDSNENAIFYADILGVKYDLNCKGRGTTGAVGLWKDDPMPAVLKWTPDDNNSVQFSMKDDDWDDYVGVNDNNKELYVQGNMLNTTFEFHMVAENELNEEQQAIYKNYLAKYDEYKQYKS